MEKMLVNSISSVSHNVFRIPMFQGRSKLGLCGKELKCNQPFPKRQTLDSSKMKEFADDNFKFDENGRKFHKRVEYTVGKGEIARYGQFLLFQKCFQKTCTADM